MQRTPLESELCRICQLRNVKNDLFIIDDLGICEDDPVLRWRLVRKTRLK